MTRIVSEPHVPLKEILPGCPDELNGILDRALAKARERRFPNCLEFAEALEAFQLSIAAHREELYANLNHIQDEFDACKKRTAELQALELIDDSILREQSGVNTDTGGSMEPVSTGASLDYGVLLERHAFLQRQLDSLTERLKTVLPLLELLRTSRVQFRNGQFEECQQSLRQVLDVFPNNSRALKLMESCRLALEENRRLAERQARLKTVLDQAREALEQGQSTKAKQFVERVLQLEPSHPEALVLHEAARQQETLQEKERKRRIAELLEKCRDSLRSGQYDDALLASAELLKLAPNEPETLELLRQNRKTSRPTERQD